jgi:O-antigen/teichoic acid export membrane protein
MSNAASFSRSGAAAIAAGAEALQAASAGTGVPADDPTVADLDAASSAATATATVVLPYATDDAPAPPTGAAAVSLRGRTVRGSAWALGGHATGQLLRFGGNLVLAWLLVPKLFGLMALVNIFIQGLGMFSDVGIGPAIIQNRRGDQPAFLNTAWTIQVGRGFVLWLCACGLAWPVAHFYGRSDPELAQLAWLIPISGLTAVLQGFNSTKLFTLNRHLMMRRVEVVEVAARVVSLVVMITWAFATRHNPTVAPLVAGGITGALVTLLMSHVALPGQRNRLQWDPSAAQELFKFGRWIFISTVLTFLAAQADRLIFGKMIPLEQLGVYSIAALMAAMPTQAIIKVVSSVMFAAFSRAREAHDTHAERFFERARLPMLVAGGVCATGMIGVGPPLVTLLYNRHYENAGWMLQLLAVSAWLQVMQITSGAALLAMGATRWVAAGNVAKLSGMVIFIPLGYRLAGFPGAIGGIIASDLLKYAVSAWAVRRHGLRVLWMDGQLSALVALGSGLALASGWMATHNARGSGTTGQHLLALLAVAVGGLLAVSVWVPIAWRSMPTAWRDRVTETWFARKSGPSGSAAGPR